MATVLFKRNDGKQFYIDNMTWKILADGLEGFDSLDVSLSTQEKAVGNGDVLQSKRYTAKDRSITAILMDNTQNFVQRKIARAFFNSNYTFSCQLFYDNSVVNCEGELYSFYLPTKLVNKHLQMSITLLCLDPFLYSSEQELSLTSGTHDIDIEGDDTPLSRLECVGSIEISINNKTMLINAETSDNVRVEFMRDDIKVYINDVLSMGAIDKSSQIDLRLVNGYNKVVVNKYCKIYYKEAYNGL